MPYADCMRCVHFKPLERMAPAEIRIAKRVAREKGYSGFWGWCWARDKPVLYTTGYCPHYMPNRWLIRLSTRSLTEYMG